MKTQVALAAFLLAGVAHLAVAAPVQQDDTAVWSEWKTTHNKQYATPEEEARRLANKKRIDEHNAKFNKVTYSMNPFSDLTSDELRLRNGAAPIPMEEAAARDPEWTQWKATHSKQYESAVEEGRRYAVFLDNKKFIDEHNAKFNKGEVSYSTGLNQFSDLTSEEFRSHHTGLKRPKRAVQNLDAMKQWADWKAEHNKQYETPAEEARRMAVFQSNKKLVDEHNAKFNKGEVTYSVGLNAFSDLTPEEFKQRHTGLGTPEDRALQQQWSEWKAQHNKQYETPAEEARRFALFKESKKRVDEHNAKFDRKEVSFSMGLNAFSDLTSDELKKRFGHGVLPSKN